MKGDVLCDLWQWDVCQQQNPEHQYNRQHKWSFVILFYHNLPYGISESTKIEVRHFLEWGWESGSQSCRMMKIF